jgi:hypothetical protein
MRVKVGAIGEMEAEFKELKRGGNHLVAIMEVPGAVPYEIIGTVNHKELMQIIKKALKMSVISFFLFGFKRGEEESRPPESMDF